jgi:hypothetical protein
MTASTRALRNQAQALLDRMLLQLREVTCEASDVARLLHDSRHYDLAALTVTDAGALREQVATLASYIA